MLTAILQHTPVYVWVLLAALVALGLSQARDREVSLARITTLPVVMIVLSAAGVWSAFGAAPAAPAAIFAWLAGIGVSLTIGARLVAARGARWSRPPSVLFVPGSWLPLVLILALFCIKYAVGVSTAMQPTLSHDSGFAVGVSLAYGVFSGLFMARANSVRRAATQSGELQPV